MKRSDQTEPSGLGTNTAGKQATTNLSVVSCGAEKLSRPNLYVTKDAPQVTCERGQEQVTGFHFHRAGGLFNDGGDAPGPTAKLRALRRQGDWGGAAAIKARRCV